VPARSATRSNGSDIPLAGLDRIQLAVFEVAEEDRSAMLLIRGDDESVGDLVVVGASRRRVVYGRLSGTPSGSGG
jgi:hypothetical protein